MLQEKLKARIKQLAQEEKEHWANLNAVVGARIELERLAAELQEEEPCTPNDKA